MGPVGGGSATFPCLTPRRRSRRRRSQTKAVNSSCHVVSLVFSVRRSQQINDEQVFIS